jgi:hypothetical protein
MSEGRLEGTFIILPMAKPVYGLVAAHPSDVYGYLNSKYLFQQVVGEVNRTGASAIRAFSLKTDREGVTFSSISGTDAVVMPTIGKERVEFEDGEIRAYNVITIYSAHFGSGTVEELVNEIKRAGYSYCSYVASNATAYAAAVGGTGDYTGANSYYSITLRAGAGSRTGTPGQPFRSVREIPESLEGLPADVNLQLVKSNGGYEFTGGFAERLSGASGANDLGTFVSYTADDVAHKRWKRFGFSSAANIANDQQYWGETDPNYDSTKGLFGGLHMPAEVTNLFDFSYSGDYSNELNPPIVDPQTDNEFRYSAADGSIDFRECLVGDLVLVRFDFNIIPQVANTTLEVAMIWQTRDANDVGNFTFALTGEPLFYGTGTVGRTFLNRPMLSAYFASAEDVNARALLAVRADNPIQVAPLTTLVTIVR